jgi:hypothetical protein
MPHINSNRRTPAATALVLVLMLACLGLAACGSSSKSSSTNANASANVAATTSTAGSGSSQGGGSKQGAGRPTAGRFAALRECLQKAGITLPKRTPGQKRPGGFLGGGAGPQLPKGVTRAQYEAALKKCGGNAFAGGGGARRFNSPAYKQALTKFSACMRENGVNVPAPNTTGKGPIFDTKGINTASAQFKTAETKCSGDLRSTFRGRAGGG